MKISSGYLLQLQSSQRQTIECIYYNQLLYVRVVFVNIDGIFSAD